VTLSRLWAFLAIALPTLAALIAPLQSVDLTYHLRAGAEILDSRTIPSTDTWTFTAAGLPWTDQQWGAQVLLAATYQVGGWTGLILLRATLVALIFGCLFAVARARGLGVRTAALLTLAAFIVSAPAISLRPQLFGMAFFAVVLWHVAGRRDHPERLWPVPILVLLWANVHGSFFLGPVVAACVTPFGPAVWAYAVGLSTNPEVTQRITEWQRTTPTDAAGFVFYASAIAVAVLLVRRGRSTPWPTLLWLAIFFVIGVYAARGIAWWSLAAVVPVAGLLVARQPDGSVTATPARPTPPLMRRLNTVVAVLIVLAGIAILPLWRPVDPGTQAPAGILANAPSGITAALRDLARPGDRLLNSQVWGSWFEFALPDLPVAIDSRIELFPPETWDAYDAVIAGVSDAHTVLERWGVTIAVVAASEKAGWIDELRSSGWQTVFSDGDGTILMR